MQQRASDPDASPEPEGLVPVQGAAAGPLVIDPGHADGRPLSAMERAFWLLDHGAPFNGFQVVSLRGPLSAGLVRIALARLQARHPLMRVRMAGDDHAPRFTECGAGPIPLSTVRRISDTQWLQLGEQEMNRRYGYTEDHLGRCTLILGQDRAELLFATHHIIGDGLSIVYAVRDLLRDLAALAQGQPLPPVESLPLTPPLTALLPAAARGLPRYVAMNAFLGKHVLLRPFRRARRLPIEETAPPESRRMRIAHGELRGEDLAALCEQARREGAGVHGALCAALLIATMEEAFAEELRAGRPTTLGCFSAINLRGKLVPPVGEAVGNFMSQATTFHRLAPMPELWELARSVKGRLAQALRWGEHYVTLPMMGMLVPWGRDPARRFIQRFDGASPAALGVTNVGQVPIPRECGPFSIENFQIAVGVSVVGQLLGAVSTWNDRLNLNLVFVEPLVSRARAERIVERALDRLRIAALQAKAA